MSVVSLPVTRPAGRALVVANPALQTQPSQLLQQLGFEYEVASDPYAAMAELCANATGYRGVVLSLQSFYREEVTLIATIKRRFPHLDVWLTHTDGRQAALAEAMRLGADGLLGEDGLHRIATTGAASDLPMARNAPESLPIPVTQEMPGEPAPEGILDEPSVSEPVLTADELRALLQEQPGLPPGGTEN